MKPSYIERVKTLIKVSHTSHNRIENYSEVGKKVSFSQPLVYIVRETPAIVPIVAQIEKELSGLHTKLDSEKVNQYIPLKTVFTIVDAYLYEDAFNGKSIYLILEAQGEKYILKDETLKRYQQPIYKGAIAPTKIFDRLYESGESIKLHFFELNQTNRHFNKYTFANCKTQASKTPKGGFVASVNFEQLRCLYEPFWDDWLSDKQPIAFEIVSKK